MGALCSSGCTQHINRPLCQTNAQTHKGGASGLTLTEAAASFLLEPSTDPGVEAQAAARIHRMGGSVASYCCYCHG